MSEPVIVFRTQSPIEADIVKGLLEAHGIAAYVQSGMPRGPFPTSIHELRLAVESGEAARAREVIESHREDPPPAQDGRGSELDRLEERIGYRFRDRGLLEQALTHSSRVHEDATGGVVDNESLEFLGDSVLGFLVADILFHGFPGWDEGQKSKLKASLVSAASLGRLGDTLALGTCLILGRGEEKTGGRRKQALIADSLEALIAAIYLDGGLDAARGFVERQFADLIAEARRTGAETAFTEDYKSALQEWLQSRERPLPVYRLASEEGPPHRRLFHVEVLVDGEPMAHAAGTSKKEAAQGAAKAALAILNRSR
jgi:ribonuclease III